MSLPVANPMAGGYSASSSAEARSGQNANEISAGYSGAGNRGFHLNVAFPGATANGSADVNPPLFGSGNASKLFLIGAIGLGAVALLLKLRRR